MTAEPVVTTFGTHRSRSPEQTWNALEPLLPRLGITRVADVTGLDELGIHTAVAVRPASETVAVSQGKGASALLARISAAVESAEAWHAERRVPAARFVATAAEAAVGYDVTTLAEFVPMHWTPATRLEWIPAERLHDGAAEWVPRDHVDLAYTRHRPVRAFRASSNGLAAGNTRTEAVLHALYEIVERDTVGELASLPLDRRTYLDLDSLPPGLLRQTARRLREGDAWVEVVVLTGRIGVPTYVAYLWSPTFPHVVAGAGSHLDPGVALFRALSEAAQSRLTAINGTRDDIPGHVYADRSPTAAPRTPPDAPRVAFAERPGLASGDLATDLARVDAAVRGLAGAPLVVDLTDPAIGLPVVRVVAAGMRFDKRHHLPRTQPQTPRRDR